MRDRLLFVGVMIASALLAVLFVTRKAPESSDEDASVDEPSGLQEAGADADESPMDAGGSALPEPDAGAENADAEAKPSAELPAYVRLHPGSAEACAPNMVLVDGIYCPYVAHRCARRAPSAGSTSDGGEEICLGFHDEVLCEGRLQHRVFCIDAFEYPNLEGVIPASMISYREAKRACALEGKRLCTSEEWEFACEGTQMWPYPYGIERDAQACNTDRQTKDAADLRVPSGTMPKCISPFGVRDMMGNVAEWAENTSEQENQAPAVLKGGSFLKGRSLCRFGEPSAGDARRAAGAGFRCCSDAKGSAQSMQAVSGDNKRKRRVVMAKP